MDSLRKIPYARPSTNSHIFPKPETVYSSKKNMRNSEREALQADLAGILLKNLHGRGANSDTMAEVEGVCKRIFLHSHSFGNYSPPPALLEALLMLSATDPSFSAQGLSCVLLLSLCSVHAWNLATGSYLFHKYPQAMNLVGKVAAANNPCWCCWPEAEQEKVSSACMTLSDLDIYVREGFVIISTPVSVALRGFRSALRPAIQGDEGNLKPELRRFVHRIPPKIWGSIPSSDLPFVLHVAFESNVAEDRFLPHISSGLLIRSPAVREYLCALAQPGLSSAKDIFLNLFAERLDYSVKAPSRMVKNLLNGTDPVSEREAYDIAKTSSDGESSSALQTAARRWMKENHLNLVSAAYLAAPKLLNCIAGSSKEICKGIQTFPRSFYSPVDHSIDRALSRILRCIPEIAATLSEDYIQDQDGDSALKKAALIYPFITLRRTKCMCAAGQTVLAGLSNPSERYKACCLRVIETLLSALSILPGSPTPEVEEFCFAVFNFVLEEKRLENGIPAFLSSVSISVMRILCRCELKGRAASLLQTLNTVISAEGSNDLVAEAARDLRIEILCRR